MGVASIDDRGATLLACLDVIHESIIVTEKVERKANNEIGSETQKRD